MAVEQRVELKASPQKETPRQSEATGQMREEKCIDFGDQF